MHTLHRIWAPGNYARRRRVGTGDCCAKGPCARGDDPPACILQELKDGTSYVHGAVYKERQPGLLCGGGEEGVGLKYRVSSQWTRFVAVERKEEVLEGGRQNQGVGEPRPSGLDDEEEWDNVIEDRGDSDDDDYGLSLSLGGLPTDKCSFLIQMTQRSKCFHDSAIYGPHNAGGGGGVVQ